MFAYAKTTRFVWHGDYHKANIKKCTGAQNSVRLQKKLCSIARLFGLFNEIMLNEMNIKGRRDKRVVSFSLFTSETLYSKPELVEKNSLFRKIFTNSGNKKRQDEAVPA